jgi:methionyl-tRNA formyltransferase
MALKIVFMGSPDFAVPALAALIEAGHEIICVYSQPPRPAGRGKNLRQTPVHAFAEARGLSVCTPKSLKSAEAQAEFAALGADLAVVVAYGLILPKAVLDAPRFGAINLHGSLLPRWRGAAPIQRALMAGDAQTGVQVMQMEEGLDTGPVLLSQTVPIHADEDAGALHDRMATAGAPLLERAVALIERGDAHFTPQAADGVTYAHKIMPAEARIDWSLPARDLDLKIRGLAPFPGAWFDYQGARIKALGARFEAGSGAPGEVLDDALLIACGDGAVRLTRVQREGKGPMAAAEFLRGTPIAKGAKLS